MKSKFLLLYTLFFLFKTTIADAENSFPDARILINQMSRANHELNYDGVFFYRFGRQIDTLRIIHKNGSNGSYERLVSLTGQAREVVRDRNGIKYVFPKDKTVVIDRNHIGKLISDYMPEAIQSVSDYYNFELVGTDRVAGMDVWIVSVRPVDKYRYGYQLWIEKKTKLLLKAELKNQLGRTLEQIMFAKIDIPDTIDSELLEPSMLGSDFTWYDHSQRSVMTACFSMLGGDFTWYDHSPRSVMTACFSMPGGDFAGRGRSKSNKSDSIKKKWKVSWMPSGFAMIEHTKESMRTSRVAVERFVYTDGFAIVSIFVEKVQQPGLNHKRETTQFGAVNTYAIQTKDGYQVTVVGEVPKMTVKRMANSIKSLH